jgi:hypothetical protein
MIRFEFEFLCWNSNSNSANFPIIFKIRIRRIFANSNTNSNWANFSPPLPKALLVDQGPYFVSQKWKSLCNENNAQLKFVPIQSHSSNGVEESRRNMLRRTFNKLRYGFPKLSNELCLLYSVKAINDTANSRDLVPTTLVFGTIPRLFPSRLS